MGFQPSASSKVNGIEHGFASSAGKSISIQFSRLRHVNHPLRVWKRTVSSGDVRPVNHMANADARVAWPHRSTSIVGVNQRSEYPSSMGQTNAVSARFISLATFFIHASFAGFSSKQTAAGLPAKGSFVNASTTYKVAGIFGWILSLWIARVAKGAGTLRRAVRRQAFARILGGRHMECAYYFDFCRLVRSYKRNIGKVAFFECNQCLRSKGHSIAWCRAPLSDDSILHVKVGKLIQKRQCLHCVLTNSCEIIDVRFVSASGMLRIRLVQT